MKIFIGILFILVTMNSYAQVTCKNTGASWQPWSTEKDIGIGLVGYGLRQQSDCLKAISNAAEGVVCNWSGSHYSPYDVKTNTVIGDESANYTTLSSCTDAINTAKHGVVCIWNMANWQVFSISEKSFIGKSGYGTTELSSCKKHMSTNSKVACNWDGKEYSAYAAGNEEPISPMSFIKPEYCTDYVSRIKSKSITKPAVSAEVLTPYQQKTTTVGYTLTKCHDSQHGYHNVKSEPTGKLVAGCVPDTLYSWGDYGKTKSFKDNYETPGNWSAPLGRDFYLTTSPLATFAYGPIALRVKLRSGIKARVSYQENKRLSCKDLSDQEKSDTLIIAQWKVSEGTGVDYIICSMGIVSSWSYGTKEHYDEILREHEWVKTHNHKEYELYYKKDGVDQLWGVNVDSHDFSEATFYRHLANQKQLIELNHGGVFSQGSDTVEDHYKTSNPIYFNPE